MKYSGLLYAFIGGAIAGAAVALLFAPEKGSETRDKIVDMMKRKGITLSDTEVDELVDQLSTETEE